MTFLHGRDSELEDFERYFRCPVVFGGDADRLEYDQETLDIAAPDADPDLLALLRGYADEAAKRRSAVEGTIRDAVETELHRLLPKSRGGGIEAVASALGLGARSLARRLAQEGTTYSEVLETLRRTRPAVQYLRDPQLSLDEIAWLLGYSEIGAFSTAFRRWSGVAPGVARNDPALLQTLVAPCRKTAPLD